MRITLIHNPGAGSQSDGDAAGRGRRVGEGGSRATKAPEERVGHALELPSVDCAPVDVNAKLDGTDISGRYLLFEVRLTNYLASWQKNRERLSVLPSHRGRQLRIEWSGFELHIDDELWPEEGARPEQDPGLRIAGAVEWSSLLRRAGRPLELGPRKTKGRSGAP